MSKKGSKINSAFGARLRMLRLERKITPGKFSTLTGIDSATLVKYEKGELEPGLTALVVIARTLEIALPELVDLDIAD